MRIIFLAICAAFLSASALKAQPQPWIQSNGPYGGWVNCLTQDASGNLWAGTQDGIFTSTDEGTHWNRLPALQTQHIINVDIGSGGTIVVAADGGGIFYSHDNGATWSSAVGISDPFLSDLIEAPNGDFYTISQNIFRSTDGGANWQLTPGSTQVYAYDLCVDSSGTLFAAAPDGFYYSTDEGQTWPKDTPGIVLGDNQGLAADRSGNLFATTGSQTWRSIDHGVTWSQMMIGTTNDPIYALSTHGGLFAAGIHTFYRSTNEGLDWWSTDTSNIFSVPRAIFALPDGHILMGNFSRIVRSTDTGHSWELYPGTMTNTFVQAMVAKASGDVFAVEGALLDPIYHSTDNGMTWSVSDLPKETATTQALMAIPDFYLYAGTSGNGIYRSTDNAGSWQSLNTVLSGLQDSFINCLAYNHFRTEVAAGTQHRGAFVTDDFGEVWVSLPLPSPTDTTVTAIGCDSANGYVMVTNSGIFLLPITKSQWTELQPLDGPYIHTLAIDPKGDIVYSDYRKGVLLGSTAGGAWQNISTGLPDSSISSLVFDRDTLYATFFDHGIYRTTDLGAHWENFSNGLAFPDVNGFAISPNGYKFAGTYGDGVYRTGSLAGVGPSVSTTEVSIYPQPANSFVHIVSNAVLRNPSIRLYNMAGTEQLSKVWNSELGINYSLDLSILPTGVYSYILDVGGSELHGKITVLK